MLGVSNECSDTARGSHRIYLETFDSAMSNIQLHEAVAESLSNRPASLPWVIAEPSVDASEILCRESQAAYIKRFSLMYFAFDRDTNRFIACVSLHNISWKIPRFEMGFWCRASAHRQGFILEAVLQLIELATSNFSARRLNASQTK